MENNERVAFSQSGFFDDFFARADKRGDEYGTLLLAKCEKALFLLGKISRRNAPGDAHPGQRSAGIKEMEASAGPQAQKRFGAFPEEFLGEFAVGGGVVTIVGSVGKVGAGYGSALIPIEGKLLETLGEWEREGVLDVSDLGKCPWGMALEPKAGRVAADIMGEPSNLPIAADDAVVVARLPKRTYILDGGA